MFSEHSPQGSIRQPQRPLINFSVRATLRVLELGLGGLVSLNDLDVVHPYATKTFTGVGQRDAGDRATAGSVATGQPVEGQFHHRFTIPRRYTFGSRTTG